MNIFKRIWDRTYWQVRRKLRRCGYCGERSNEELGRVNYGIAFEKPRRQYHRKCLQELTR